MRRKHAFKEKKNLWFQIMGCHPVSVKIKFLEVLPGTVAQKLVCATWQKLVDGIQDATSLAFLPFNILLERNSSNSVGLFVSYKQTTRHIIMYIKCMLQKWLFSKAIAHLKGLCGNAMFSITVILSSKKLKPVTSILKHNSQCQARSNAKFCRGFRSVSPITS